jgi:ATP-dependent helicase HrpA
MSTSAPAELTDRLPDLMLRDAHRLRGRLAGTRKLRDASAKQSIMAQIAADVAAAETRVRRRRDSVPALSYPAQLPVSARKDDIAEAIRDNQVVIVAGETGSGKTTQLPKICLELGRGVQGMIGHTQPRRLAARTVAERVAEELDTPLGGPVGWKVRFTDQAGEDTLLKVMTDGILLAEIKSDRLLRQYDTLIIDEAHERSLNIDFILGYLEQLLPQRPDLKVIITSATIDPERFARHFGDAPVIEVSGRTYPVEVRYRPLAQETEDEDAEQIDRDQTQAISDAVRELCAEGPGDILVFLSGEREIRETAEALTKERMRGVDVLPLYGRQTAAEQHRVFEPGAGGARRIVLATNVAETSLTVPGIKYVIDPGTARISRYSRRLKVQRLPVEPISQASANQRKGRCGRVSDGICVRLYSEEDFLARPEFTDPEILRTNLASVILQMAAAGLNDIESFEFIDPPDNRSIADGRALLEELGALEQSGKDSRGRLTKVGRRLAQLPVDPRMGRMVVEAEQNGCEHQVMVIVAALSIQDPRERPAEKQQAADEKHSRFTEKSSDFLSYLNLWQYLREQQRALSGNQFRKLCRTEFLNYLRVREWQDIYVQLCRLGDIAPRQDDIEAADENQVHRAILAGLLSHIGMYDAERRDYQGPRGARFAIFPGSALFKKSPRWVMAAELVETTRLWGRVAASIEPEWVEKLATHLVKRNYAEPHWERKRGAVVAYEKVTLYGLPIVSGRKVNYAKVDPELCRELFIRRALVEGDWTTDHEFFHRNRELLDEVEELEQRARRRGILVDEETLFDFYDKRVGAEVVTARHFDSWWKKVRKGQPDLLTFEKAMLINATAGGVSDADYPDVWRQGDLEFELRYQFEPGAAADGVTVRIPISVLNQVGADQFSWQVPGLRQELATALVKSLPKPIRRYFAPAPDHAAAALHRIPQADRELPLTVALGRELRRISGVEIPDDAWDLTKVPDHLKITFQVVDQHGEVSTEGRDLDALRARLRPRLRRTLAEAAKGIERSGLSTWDFEKLPKAHSQEVSGQQVTSYPALVDEGDSVAVRVFATEAEQRDAMWAGTRKLVLLGVGSPAKQVTRGLGNAARLALGRNPHGGLDALLEDCITCAADKLIADAGGPPDTREGFAALREYAGRELTDTVREIVDRVQRILATAHQVEARLDGMTRIAPPESVRDIRAQLAELIHPGFVTVTGARRLDDLLRYLRAIEQRLDKLENNPARDVEWTRSIDAVRKSYVELSRSTGPGAPGAEALAGVRWMIEELRVSYFAQTLRTAYPISEKRIKRALDALTA